jgi:hypothetical protein
MRTCSHCCCCTCLLCSLLQLLQHCCRHLLLLQA